MTNLMLEKGDLLIKSSVDLKQYIRENIGKLACVAFFSMSISGVITYLVHPHLVEIPMIFAIALVIIISGIIGIITGVLAGKLLA